MEEELTWPFQITEVATYWEHLLAKPLFFNKVQFTALKYSLTALRVILVTENLDILEHFT